MELLRPYSTFSEMTLIPVDMCQHLEPNALWGFFNKSNATWWINFFKDMVDGRLVDLTQELEIECLWFCFSKLLQNVLDEVKEHWNTHRIRKSRRDTLSGWPDSLYYLPELHWVSDQFLLAITGEEMNYTRSYVIESDSDNDYQEYINNVTGVVILGNQLIGKKHQSSTKFSCSLPIMEACDQHRGNYFGGNFRNSLFQRVLHHRE